MKTTISRAPTIWIVTPCYDDVPSFLRLREDVLAELGALPATQGAQVHFVVVDDRAGEDPEIRRLSGCADVSVVEPPFNLGHQRALVYGLRVIGASIAASDVVLTLDADGEDRPSDVPALVGPLLEGDLSPGTVVLACRTRRRESLAFKSFYVLFKLMFRILTGTTIRSGNFAAYRGGVVHRLLRHPHFDLCYSSTFIALNVPTHFVPCPRGERYAGQSRMNRNRLILHGLRMLMPFMDRIALRALGGFTALVVVAALFLVGFLGAWAFLDLSVGAWTIGLSLALLVVAFIGIACCIILFALFAQSGGISLSGLEESDARWSPSTSARPG